MNYDHQTKILIAGPTGTGTTFLIGLMHRLGFDTGFEDDHVTDVVSGRGKGLEYVRNNRWRKPWLAAREDGRDISPHVIKQPIQDHGDDGGTGIICDVLDVVDENGWNVEHLFLTVRSLTSVVKSVSRREKTGDSVMHKVRGELRERELLAAEGFYKLVCKLAVRDHPYTLIEFPKSVDDPTYCFRKLRPVLNPILAPTTFLQRHAETAYPKMVHIR